MSRSDADPTLVGELLDERYELLDVIGSGGVGMVYRARQINLDRLVAVKVLHESLVDQPGLAGRFQREAAAMSRLYHPHCASVIDCGVHASRPYLVLEFLPGQTIRQLLGQGRLSPSRAAQLGLQLLRTLEYFHDHHVIHRDLKAENVMLVPSIGNEDFIKVLDFGMAKILTGPGADSQLSKIGLVPGTPSAMAPEQIYQLPPDPRIDIYATGILLYEMLVGERPFTGPDLATIVKMQLSTPPRPPRRILGDHALSAELEQVVMKSLEKDRVDRFGTADEMATALLRTPEIGGQPARSGARALRLSTTNSSMMLQTASVAFALGIAVLWLWPTSRELKSNVTSTSPAARPPPSAASAHAPAAAPTPPPPAAQPAAAAGWLARRDEAVRLAGEQQHDAAWNEVRAALALDPAAARADPALVEVAVTALDSAHLSFVIDTFGSNPQLPEALSKAVARGGSAERRRAAYAGLRALDRETPNDLVAMRTLDVEEATSCSAMRTAFKPLRSSKNERVAAFKAELRSRGPKDRHARCLKRFLRH